MKPVLKKDEMQMDLFPWGHLQWYAREALNGEPLTLGFCHIRPCSENTAHFHPNCTEILCVLKGRILHTYDGISYEMAEGDSITIAPGVVHNARNLTDEEVILSIAFNTGERETVNA